MGIKELLACRQTKKYEEEEEEEGKSTVEKTDSHGFISQVIYTYWQENFISYLIY